MVARVACTLVLPHEVHAAAVGAEVCAQLALVDVDARGDVWGQLMARRALAAVAAVGVETRASSAEEGVSLTLVDIHAVLHHHEAALVTLLTLALEVPGGVDTLAPATEVGRDAALVNVCAVPLFRIQGEAAVTPALKAADGVAALAVGAEARDHLALVDVFEERFPICDVFCGKARASGAELLVLGCVPHRTFLALVSAPGSPDRAATGVHAMAAGDGEHALLVLIPQEAGLQADIKADPSGGIQRHPIGALTLE